MKVKTIQNIFIIKAKVNSNNIKQETYKTKQAIYVAIVNKIVANTNNYKQENFDNTIQYRQFCVIAKNIFR